MSVSCSSVPVGGRGPERRTAAYFVEPSRFRCEPRLSRTPPTPPLPPPPPPTFHQPYRTKAMTDGAADVRPWSAAGRSIRSAAESQRRRRRQHHRRRRRRLFPRCPVGAVCTSTRTIAVIVVAPRDSLDSRRTHVCVCRSAAAVFLCSPPLIFVCVEVLWGCYFS